MSGSGTENFFAFEPLRSHGEALGFTVGGVHFAGRGAEGADSGLEGQTGATAGRAGHGAGGGGTSRSLPLNFFWIHLIDSHESRRFTGNVDSPAAAAGQAGGERPSLPAHSDTSTHTRVMPAGTARSRRPAGGSTAAAPPHGTAARPSPASRNELLVRSVCSRSEEPVGAPTHAARVTTVCRPRSPRRVGCWPRRPATMRSARPRGGGALAAEGPQPQGSAGDGREEGKGVAGGGGAGGSWSTSRKTRGRCAQGLGCVVRRHVGSLASGTGSGAGGLRPGPHRAAARSAHGSA